MNAGQENDTATIIFTSGTTGVPKGVELSHKNFLCQIKDLAAIFPMRQGDKSLAVLPVWHVYEREMEYYLVATGVAICYSKPVVSMIIADMRTPIENNSSSVHGLCTSCVGWDLRTD